MTVPHEFDLDNNHFIEILCYECQTSIGWLVNDEERNEYVKVYCHACAAPILEEELDDEEDENSEY